MAQVSKKKNKKKAHKKDDELRIGIFLKQTVKHYRSGLSLWLKIGAISILIELFFTTTLDRASANAWSSMFSIILNLALIFAVRHLLSGDQVSIKHSFYSGSAPLVKFMLTLVFVVFQLIPFSLGAMIYSAAIVQSLSPTLLEHIVFVLIWFILALPSFYWLSGSVFGVYIVTLPDITPVKAIRAGAAIAKDFRALVSARLILLLFMVLFASMIFLMGTSYLIDKVEYSLAVTTALFIIVVLPYVHIYLFATYKQLSELK